MVSEFDGAAQRQTLKAALPGRAGALRLFVVLGLSTADLRLTSSEFIETAA